MTNTHHFLAAVLLAGGFSLVANGQAFVGLTADFEDGTTQGFGVGGMGAQPSILSGGPDGNFLQSISVGGAGPNSAQLIQNQSTFTGDFLSAGITGLTATVRVDPTSEGPLALRLAFTNSLTSGGQANGTGFSSVDPVIVENDGDFVDVFFPINETDLTVVPGTGTDSFEDVFSSIARLRILAAASGPVYIVPPADRFASTLQIDNITLVGVPEPASALLLLGGLACLPLGVRRRS